MEKMLKEGVVGEAEPMFKDELHESEHHKIEPESPPKDSVSGNSDFNDVNYWRSEYSQSVVEE